MTANTARLRHSSRGSCPTGQHLEFRDSHFYPVNLQAMLAACSNLKTFDYDVGKNFRCRGYQLGALRESLTTTKDSLENLWLDHWGHEDYVTLRGIDVNPIGSLVEFTKLKNLRVRMYVFFGPGENWITINCTLNRRSETR